MSETRSFTQRSSAQLAWLSSPFRSQATSSQNNRYWEIDALRGVAIVMMVIYHLVYDLYYFAISETIFTNPFWFYFQRTTASAFILLVGVSLALRYQHLVNRHARVPFRLFLRRGSVIFGWGMVITGITWLVLGPQLAIRFGILHLIGVATVAAYPLLGRRWLNLALGLLCLMLGKFLQTLTFELPWLVWLGFAPADHAYVDYFPFIKWFGVVLLGIFAGHVLYGAQGRRFVLPDLADWPPVRILQYLGYQSLPIYLLHQPLLLGFLLLLFALVA